MCFPKEKRFLPTIVLSLVVMTVPVSALTAVEVEVVVEEGESDEFIGIRRPAPVSEVEVPTCINLGDVLVVILYGTLPSSLFKIVEIPYEYRIEDGTIMINPIMGNNPDADPLSVTVNYGEVVRIFDLEEGFYDVVVEGDGALFTRQVEVRDCPP